MNVFKHQLYLWSICWKHALWESKHSSAFSLYLLMLLYAVNSIFFDYAMFLVNCFDALQFVNYTSY